MPNRRVIYPRARAGGGVRGRGNTSYSSFFHDTVRQVLVAHAKKREYGRRAIYSKLMNFEPDETVPVEAYDTLTPETIRDFCKSGRFISDALMEHICSYLRQSEPNLASIFEEAEFQENVGEVFMQFYGDTSAIYTENHVSRDWFGKPGLYITFPNAEWPALISNPDNITFPETAILYFLYIQEIDGQSFCKAAKMAIENPWCTELDREEPVFSPIPQFGYAVRTAWGNVLMMRQEFDRIPVIEFCQSYHPNNGYFTQVSVTRNEAFRSGGNDRINAWIYIWPGMRVYQKVAPAVEEALDSTSWMCRYGRT